MLDPEGIVGAKIQRVRPMTRNELAREGWDEGSWSPTPMALVLDSGVVLYPSRDEEGNGGGCLFGHDSRSKRSIMLVAATRPKAGR